VSVLFGYDILVWLQDYLSAHFRTLTIELLFCHYCHIFVSTDPYWAIFVSGFQHFLWCLQNSIVVHTALTDLVIWVLLNTHPYSAVCVSMYHDFKPLSFSHHCASKYMTIPLNANPYPMISESSLPQTPWKRSLAQLENGETQGIANSSPYCATLMNNGPFLNQLLLMKSMARMKLDWWHCISQYSSLSRYTCWYLLFWLSAFKDILCSVRLN
jgi:hypothetical protein